MLKAAGNPGDDARKQIVERAASSRHIGKSARLRDLLIYLCNRVLEESAEEIHEQEVGHKVFGRAPDYDTTVDNIVRVHASQLRKRLELYFSDEGRDEPWTIEIPKGNYAPIFNLRATHEAATPTAGPYKTGRRGDWRIWILAGLTLVFASSALFLLIKVRSQSKLTAGGAEEKSAVKLFWSQVFAPGQQTDIVLDDATIGLYQELAGRTVSLSEYFDRSYLRRLNETASGARLDSKQADVLVTRRYSTYASSHLLWQLFQVAGPLQAQSGVYFSRDYTFRGIKSNNVLLLGNSRSNPWIEPFEARLGIRWTFQDDRGTYHPVDTLANPPAPTKFRISTDYGDTREGYCMVALLPNLGGTGKVMIISATGGSALSAGAGFFLDERSVAHLRSMLPGSKEREFPYFESLLQIKSRSSLPKDVTVLLCRGLRS